MKRMNRYIAITIVLAILLAACGKKEETKPVDTEIQEATTTEEKTYHTDEFWGCKYSVPNSWVVTKNETQVNYQIGDNGLLMMMFSQQDISDDQWDEGAKALIKTLDETDAISIKEYAPLESVNRPTYSMKGDFINNGQTYQYDAYAINVDNKVLLLIQKAVADDTQDTEKDLNKILDTFDSSGLTEYLGSSANDKGENGDEAVEALKAELREKYDITEPSTFVRGDATGNWRIVKVANSTPPSEYAVDYAKAYMKDGDIHFVVNFSLNTTTMFNRYSNGTTSVIEAKTTEYVDKEEHDATIIGEGLLLTDNYYDIATGEQITNEGSEEAGTVDADVLIAAVEEAIEGQVGEGEDITGVEFDGSNLTVYVDMSGADTSFFSAHDIALSRISSITDQILALDDEYYNTWKTVTVDFGDVGKAVLDKSIVKDQGFGKFFDFTDDYLK